MFRTDINNQERNKLIRRERHLVTEAQREAIRYKGGFEMAVPLHIVLWLMR